MIRKLIENKLKKKQFRKARNLNSWSDYYSD